MALNYIDLNFGCKSGLKIRGLKHRRAQFCAQRPTSSPIEHDGAVGRRYGISRDDDKNALGPKICILKTIFALKSS
jgi:hypothetical protein